MYKNKLMLISFMTDFFFFFTQEFNNKNSSQFVPFYFSNSKKEGIIIIVFRMLSEDCFCEVCSTSHCSEFDPQ